MFEKLEDELELVERHMSILRLIVKKQPMGIVSISDEIGEPNHKVRYSMRVLEDESLIEPTSRGAVPTEETEEFLSQHDSEIGRIVEKLEDMRFSQAIST